MTRAEFLDALDAHVQTLVDLRTPELRQANATLLVKLKRAQAEIGRLRKQINGIVDDEVRRAKLASTRQGSDTVTLAEVQRVVRGYDSAHRADTVGPVPRLHERLARSLLARMEKDA